MSTPCTLFNQQWMGNAKPSSPWVIFWGPFFSPSTTESSSPVDSVPPNPTQSRCSSGFTKIIREKHLLDLVFLVHKSARYFHLFGTPAFEFTAADASFDGKYLAKPQKPQGQLSLCCCVGQSKRQIHKRKSFCHLTIPAHRQAAFWQGKKIGWLQTTLIW